jgi:hypothetical protein
MRGTADALGRAKPEPFMTATATVAADSLNVYVAGYGRLRDARIDYEKLTRRCAALIVHTYETTVVSGELDGKLRIATMRSPDRGKAWVGLAAGRLDGLFFPPFLWWDDSNCSSNPLAVAPFWRGLSQNDLRVITDVLEGSAAAMIVISESELSPVLNDARRGTIKTFRRLVTTAA